MTNALYWTNCYLKEFEGKVLKIDGNKIILDQTAFYPESGGQPCDFGKLIKGTEEFNIVNVTKENEEIIHYTDKLGLKEGDSVKGMIDWDRRFRLMRMHTATHILSSIIALQTGASVTGSQIGLDKSRIDFNALVDKGACKDYFTAANDAVKWNLPIQTDLIPVEQMANDKKLSKFKMPAGLKEARIVEIEIFDKQPDVGTHVAWTEEVGKIELVDVETKDIGTSVYFKVE